MSRRKVVEKDDEMECASVDASRNSDPEKCCTEGGSGEELW